ncbi:DUF1934 domain-containing protein [Roseburia hominis]|uniref:DUF1934 domain-containing protein n=1 Tax=Roseburia hominis TaxID=301301 RepID=UPI001F2E252D|nr:DUF1934 domain-containing protein [Roseburia hominis]
MTKDVLLSIKGLQFANEQDTEPVEVITSGDYYKRNGKHYILYDEVMEGFEGVTKNIIKLKENCLDVTKKGVTNVHMMFEKNKKNITYYNTPFGSIMIGIDAKDIKIEEKEESILVNVSYGLEVNYEHMADCNIVMNIQSKESGKFNLLN